MKQPMTPHHTIATRMRELRRGRGWSQERLAQAMRDAGIGWERMVVTKLENGRRDGITVEELLALAYVLNVAPIELMVPADADAVPYRPAPGVDPESPTAVRAWILGTAAIGTVDDPRSAILTRDQFEKLLDEALSRRGVKTA